MAEDYYDLPINKHTDWGGDSSTNNKPVTGKQVQAFIKDTLEQKIGVVYLDEEKGIYLVFSDIENRDKYLENPTENSHLLIDTFVKAKDGLDATLVHEYDDTTQTLVFKSSLINLDIKEY